MAGRWVVAQYGKKTFGLGQSGGPAQLMMRPPTGEEPDRHFKALMERIVDKLNESDYHGPG